MPPTRWVHVVAEFSVRLCTLLPNPPAVAQLLGLWDCIPRVACTDADPLQREATSLVLSFPRRLPCVKGGGIVEIVVRMLQDCAMRDATQREALILLFIAGLPEHVSRDVLSDWASAGGFVPPLPALFTVRRNYFEAGDAGAEVLSATTEMLVACAQFDMRDRYTLCRDFVLRGWPSYAKDARDALLVFLGHFSSQWRAAYLRAVRLDEADVRRATELVRGDISILAIAVSRVSLPRIHLGFFQRFQAVYYEGADPVDPPDLALRKALAATTAEPVELWLAFGWACTPRERRALLCLAEEGFSPTIREAVQLTLCQMRAT